MLLILNVSAATAVAHAPKEQPANTKEQKQSKKQENIETAYKALRSHTFKIIRFSHFTTEYGKDYELFLWFDDSSIANHKVISEKYDDRTNKYNLIFHYNHAVYGSAHCILLLDLKSGRLEIREYRDYEKSVANDELMQRKSTRLIFNGNYANVQPLP